MLRCNLLELPLRTYRLVSSSYLIPYAVGCPMKPLPDLFMHHGAELIKYRHLAV